MSITTGHSADDHSTTVAQLRDVVRSFVAERQWQQFHAPKNLSMALAIEAAELMEHFQWVTVEDSRAIGATPERQTAVEQELADVLCYVLALANELQVDLTQVVRAKMELNARKYPINEIRGRYGHDDPRPAAT
ncbi:MAG: nucleotide pyrophosphohydrolase [Pirellulaceae bacterium]